jgi:hypothetical protein
VLAIGFMMWMEAGKLHHQCTDLTDIWEHGNYISSTTHQWEKKILVINTFIKNLKCYYISCFLDCLMALYQLQVNSSSSVSTVTRLWNTASRLALGPTQPPIQWVMGALSPGVNLWDMKLTTHLHLLSHMDVYFQSHTHIHGIVLHVQSNFTFTWHTNYRECVMPNDSDWNHK